MARTKQVNCKTVAKMEFAFNKTLEFAKKYVLDDNDVKAALSPEDYFRPDMFEFAWFSGFLIIEAYSRSNTYHSLTGETGEFVTNLVSKAVQIRNLYVPESMADDSPKMFECFNRQFLKRYKEYKTVFAACMEELKTAEEPEPAALSPLIEKHLYHFLRVKMSNYPIFEEKLVPRMATFIAWMMVFFHDEEITASF